MATITDLLHSNEISKVLLNSIPAGVMMIDEQQKVTFANHQMAQLLELPSSTNLNTAVENFIRCLNFSGGFEVCDKTNNCQVCTLMKPKVSTITSGKTNQDSAQIVLTSENKTIKKDLLITSTAIKLERDCYALVLVEDITEVSRLRQQLRNHRDNMGIWGDDPKIVALRKQIKTLAHIKFPVLISGESGTGKELVAQAIHNQGYGKNKPFIPVNSGAIPDSLLESELFGHVKGAFTGATHDRKGRFTLADGGTLFLDEIGDISPAMQVKLLRVIQEGTFDRVGDEKSHKVDVRIICATNKDLKKEIDLGNFREDLYYRICVCPLFVPPLRDRKDDIPIISKYMLNSLSASLNNHNLRISEEALNCLLNYNWPGNIRELENALKHAIINCPQDEIMPEHFPSHIYEDSALPLIRKRSRKRKLEKAAVVATLEKVNWNKMTAARELGVSRATLYRFMDDMDIEL